MCFSNKYSSLSVSIMPPKTKRQKQLQLAALRATQARQDSKKARLDTSEDVPAVAVASVREIRDEQVDLSLPSTSRALHSVERSASEDTTEDPNYDPEQDLYIKLYKSHRKVKANA